MDTLFAFIVAAALTFFFVRGYLKKLTAGRSAPAKPATPVAPPQNCPRCSKQFPKGAAFCPHCGAPLAMWNIHRAEARGGPQPVAEGRAKPLINASLCVGCGSCVHECPESGTLEMVSGKAILANPERCAGHKRCADVCPTQAISLVVGGALQTIKVPNITENFETNIPGLYIVGELGGMGLIKTAINEGKLVIDYIRKQIASQGDGDIYDVVIAGAGPAGLSASLSAHQYELRYLTLEQGEIAATIRQYPRQKFLMAEPLNIPLYGNLYVADGTKEALLSVWENIIANTGVRIRTNEKVERLQRTNFGFEVVTPNGSYQTRTVVLAIGRRGTPRKIGCPGEQLSKVAYRLIEAGDYENNDVLVVGGGDSAIEAALALSRSGKNRVTLCHRGDSFRRARERNQQLIATAAASGRVQLLWNAQVTGITAESVSIQTPAGEQTLPNDFVFVMIGGEAPDEFLRRTGIEIVEKVLTAPEPSFA